MARILIVDDENNIRMMMRLALQIAPHEVETASDGAEALQKFGDGHAYDLVLLDQRMPDMEGLDVLREMRRKNAAARVVMVTAFGTIDLAAKAAQFGATDFLRKPFTTEILRATVQAALENRATSENSASAKSDSTQLNSTPNSLPKARFNAASINGFRIHSSTRLVGNSAENAARIESGAVRSQFEIADAARTFSCEVVLPNYFVEAVKAHADREEIPDPAHFWLWLSEEALANYLWQKAEIPPRGELQIDELTSSLKRWIDAMLSK